MENPNIQEESQKVKEKEEGFATGLAKISYYILASNLGHVT